MLVSCNRRRSRHSRPDGSTHGLVGHFQEARCNLLDAQLFTLLLRVYGLSQLLEGRSGSLSVQRLVLVGPEDLWAGRQHLIWRVEGTGSQLLGQESSQEQVGVGDSEVASFAVRNRTGVSAGRLNVSCGRAKIGYRRTSGPTTSMLFCQNSRDPPPAATVLISSDVAVRMTGISTVRRR